MSPGTRCRSSPGTIFHCLAFSVLELMIVCGLLALLLSLAVPAFRQYLQRTHRSTAIEALLTAAGCEERIYASEFSYDTHRCLPLGKQEQYKLRFEPANMAATSTYVLIAEPTGAQREDPCGFLSLDQSGRRGIGGPVERLRQCWGAR